MAAVASFFQPALNSAPPSQVSTHSHQAPPRLLLRLPPEPEVDGRRHPLKRKWRSIVNFFALPIRSYYLEPPGLAYRQQLRARRDNPWDDHDHLNSFRPCPVYTDQVGDDEMVLFKAQEEAEALAAMQRDQRAAAEQQWQQQVSSSEANGAASDGEEEGQVEQLASSSDTEAIASPVAAPTEPSPQYEQVDPLLTFSTSSSPAASQPIPTPQRPRLRMRTRTSSNLSPASHPSLSNGITMSRQHSTPLSPTIASLSSSPPLSRRARAQTNAVRPTISEPLSWTLVRSQYSYPKRGLSAEQMAFLSSVESLGRFGVGEVNPSPAYERGDREGSADYGFPSVERV